MRISVIQHAANEGPGEIGKWAAERGHPMQICHQYLGQALPELDAFDLLVVMGGEMNVYQDRDYPWLKAERALVRTALEKGKPVAGICLGAQLIADALGSRVTQNPVYELGWFPVRFTEGAKKVFPQTPEAATAMHWHGDTFTLPEGAIRVGESDACSEQGFVIPGKCLGLQFHFEIDPELAREFVDGSDLSRWPKGEWVQSPKTVVAEAAKYCADNRRLLFHLLDVFCSS